VPSCESVGSGAASQHYISCVRISDDVKTLCIIWLPHKFLQHHTEYRLSRFELSHWREAWDD